MISKCKLCEGDIEHEPVRDMPWARPTICNDCSAKREQDRLDQIKARELETIREEVEKLPFPNWNTYLGNNSLRTMIGQHVFCDGVLNNRSLYIQGPVRCGKTRSVSSVGRVVIERGGEVNYTHCLKLLKSYSGEFMSGDSDKYLDVAGTGTSVLIIDDLGVGKVTERGAELLYYIIDERMIRNLPTWLTSNFVPEEIEEWFSPQLRMYAKRIIARINEYYTIIKATRS